MTITCKLISEVVSGNYAVSLRELYSQRRAPGIVLPRQMSWYLAKILTSRTYPEIGRYMGGRDHSTVMHGIRRMSDAIINDTVIAANYESLVRQISALGKASETNELLATELGDLDPLDIATAVLDAPADGIMPSVNEIRALCMGVRHFADECSIAVARATAQTDAIGILEAERLRQLRAIQLHLKIIERSAAVVAAAEKISAAAKELTKAFDTNGERPARKALEAQISNLQTIFERA
jgi:hypothetical protein